MNGPDHYRAAEDLLTVAADVVNEATPATTAEAIEYSGRLLAAAQVHATLADAAATIELANVTADHGSMQVRHVWWSALTSAESED